MNSPEGPNTAPTNDERRWGAPSQQWPAPYQPYPSYPGYPPAPETYMPSAQPGAYPPPPSWYQPGQPGAQAPTWAPYGQPAPYPSYPGYPQAPAPAAQQAPHSRTSATAVVGFVGKLAVLAKVALPLLSVLASFGAYALLFGWQFGLGIIVLLFIHEMGHFVIIRGKGLPASLPVFIPLLGAYVAMRKMPLSVRDEAEIGIAGPIAGTVAGVVCLWLYAQAGLAIMLPLAYFSFFLNLLNLIPVSPLDGARVTSAISKWIWLLGLVGIGVGAWFTGNILLILLGVVGFFQMIERFRVSEKTPYYTISAGARIYVTLLYFGLVAVLVYATVTLQPLMQATGSPL